MQRDLAAAISDRGHDVELVEIPFHSAWEEMLEQMLAIRLLDLTTSADVLIAIRTPSYILRHPNKRLWFIHHHRGAYDLWGTQWQDIPETPEGLAVRDAIVAADNRYLREARHVFTNSRIVGERLSRYNGVDSEVLYPPLGNPGTFSRRDSEGYFFYPSRIVGHKRQRLVVEAAARMRSGARVVIAGVPDNLDELEGLERLIRAHELEDRVELVPRWISEEEKAERMSRCLGVLYVPFEEDSYGYVTLEAFHSGKPVITCSDSGGTLEIVEEGVTGIVCEPAAVALAAAMDRLSGDPGGASAMGLRGREELASKEISWDNVVSRLLG